jgi:hypothetical protein
MRASMLIGHIALRAKGKPMHLDQLRCQKGREILHTGRQAQTQDLPRLSRHWRPGCKLQIHDRHRSSRCFEIRLVEPLRRSTVSTVLRVFLWYWNCDSGLRSLSCSTLVCGSGIRGRTSGSALGRGPYGDRGGSRGGTSMSIRMSMTIAYAYLQWYVPHSCERCKCCKCT